MLAAMLRNNARGSPFIFIPERAGSTAPALERAIPAGWHPLPNGPQPAFRGPSPLSDGGRSHAVSRQTARLGCGRQC
jgi:hypothetical protein